ncbi:MAG: hypothetical protein HXK81_02195 [Lachnospiraceae bacterium]|nr:hypothetical protein [Lachnospiraceae bacterium]
MMWQIVGILKIIGCCLAFLVCVLLLFLFLFLFVPLRYRLEGHFYPGDTEPQENRYFLHVSFSWFFHLIRGGISLPGEGSFTIRVAFWTLLPRKDRQLCTGRRRGRKEEKQTADQKDAERMMAVEDSDPKETDAEAFAGDHAEREEAEQREGKEERRTDAMEESLEEENSDDSLKHNLYERIRFFSVFSARVWEFLKKPYQVLKRIQYTIYSMYVRISMVKALLESDAFASAFRLALRKMGVVIRSLLPKSGKAELTIGLDNPADTASVLALYGILSPFLPRGVKVFANFEEPILTGDFRLHGRITCFCILRCGLALWMDGNVRRVVRRFQKIINR